MSESAVAATCPSCNTENSRSANFCRNCGAKLASSESVSPSQIQQPNVTLPMASQQLRALSIPKNGMKAIFIAVGIVLLLSAFGVSWYLLSQPTLLAAASVGGKFGFIDKNGNWIIAPHFDNVGGFYEVEASSNTYTSDK